MAVTFLKPDKIITTDNGLTIKQKIIPDSLIDPKDVASWIRKGQCNHVLWQHILSGIPPKFPSDVAPIQEWIER